MELNYEIAFYVASTTLIVLCGLLVWAVGKVMQRRLLEHEIFENALSALGEAVQAIDDFAAEDHRTLDSLKETKGSFLFETNQTAKTAKMRGLEVYRNHYVEKHQNKVRASLKQYNRYAEELLTEVLGYRVEERGGVKVLVRE